ncbi:uncharacterized protein LOC134853701 [Symsagittifera roscoffensis]|uniref:uncharacterized protein LOC134853701 n=1 Tax=Symsagittifera roscoffensis TaxID=84072 RepID=UPI00307C04D6
MTSDSPNTLMVYVQSIILLLLAYSYYIGYGWYTLDSPNGEPYYYLSPLSSCLFRASYSFQFQDFLQMGICQPTVEFSQHISKNASEADVKEMAIQVQFLARFMVGCATLSLVLFMAELFSHQLNRMVKTSLATFSGALVLIQFTAQMRLFSAMWQLVEEIRKNADKDVRIVGPEFDFDDDLGASFALGFFIALFASCLYVGSFSYSIYRVVQIVLDVNEDPFAITSKKSTASKMPRYISATTKNGYQKIDDESLNGRNSGLLISGSSEHF